MGYAKLPDSVNDPHECDKTHVQFSHDTGVGGV